MDKVGKYVGLDVHKDTIAVADAGRGKSRFHGVIENTPATVSTLLRRLGADGEVLGVCCEADP